MKVFEVLYQVDDESPSAHRGPAGDGSFVFRTRSRREAERFAEGKEVYGGPAEVHEFDAPARLAQRWGLA